MSIFEDIIDFCKLVGFRCLLCVSTLGLLGWFINSIELRSCMLYGDNTGFPTHYESFDNCYIQVDGVTTTLEHYEALTTYGQIQNIHQKN